VIDYEGLNGVDTGGLPRDIDNLNDYLASLMVTVSGCLRIIVKETQVVTE